MPMIDYQCLVCGYRTEEFHHSDPPDMRHCAHMLEERVCGGMAPRISSYPGEYRPTNARRFDPIVLWVDNTNPDRVSFPPRADEPVQDGYHAVEITNLPQADHWTNRLNDVAREEAMVNRENQKLYFEEKTRERRADIRARIGSDPRMNAMFREAQAYVDKKREKKYSGPMDPRGHFQVLSYDSSNRQSYSSQETGWRERKS